MTEPNSQSHSFAENFKAWTQTGGIIIAAGWAVYTFVYKEITAPKSAPVNITLDLQLKKIEPLAPEQGLTAIEARCSAKNPSSREVQLLPSAWIAYGSTIAAKADDSHSIEEATATLQDKTGLRPWMRHATRDKISMIATGHLFKDTGLKPGEATTRTLVLYVPKNTYNQLDFIAVMPSAENTSGIQLAWRVSADEELVDELYHLDPKGERLPSPKAHDHQVLQKQLWQQVASARATIFLGF
jgi:hypothetical protein